MSAQDPTSQNDLVSQKSSLASEISWLFLREYYKTLCLKPSSMHMFYKQNSVFSHGHEPDPLVARVGRESIKSFIENLEFLGKRIILSTIDTQTSHGGGIILMVVGEVCDRDVTSAPKSPKKFSQTFFLASQPNGYYILNDIFRYIKHENNSNWQVVEDNFVESTDQIVSSGVVAVDILFDKNSPEDAQQLFTSGNNQRERVCRGVQQKSDTQNQQETSSHKSQKTHPANAQDLQHSQKPSQPAVKTDLEAQRKDQSVKKKSAATPLGSSAVTTPQTPEANVSINQQPTEQSAQQVAESPAEQQSSPPKPVTYASRAAENVKNVSQPSQQQATPTTYYAAPPVRPNVNVAGQKSTVGKPVKRYNGGESQQHNANSTSRKDEFGHYSAQGKPSAAENTNAHPHHSGKPRDDHHYEEREKFSVYVRNVNDKITKEQLTTALQKIGPVANVTISAQRGCAFVDFESADSSQKAIGSQINIDGHTVSIEGRKKPNRPYRPYSNYHSQGDDGHESQYRGRYHKSGGIRGGHYNEGGEKTNAESGPSKPSQRHPRGEHAQGDQVPYERAPNSTRIPRRNNPPNVRKPATAAQ